MVHLRVALALWLASVLCACPGPDPDPDPVPVPPDAETFTFFLSGVEEVPQAATPATGTATAVLDGDRLTVDGTFSGLVSPLLVVGDSSAHIHVAPMGENGPVVFDLDVIEDEDGLGGTFTLDATLTADQVEILRAGDYYVNVHTEDFPAGEIRGQIVEEGEEPALVDAHFFASLLPEHETAPVVSDATGWTRLVVRGDEAIVSGRFDDLSSELVEIDGTPAHIHEAPVGVDGPVVIDLEVEADEDLRGGTLHFSGDLTAAQRGALDAGDLYVNVHTEQYPAGEIRGQLHPAEPVTEVMPLTGDAEVPPALTAATGEIRWTLEGNALSLVGDFQDLEGDPLVVGTSEAHIHEGAADEVGPVVFDVDVFPDETGRAGTLSVIVELLDDEIRTLEAGRYYFNLHTTAFPEGELRGQFELDRDREPPENGPGVPPGY